VKDHTTDTLEAVCHIPKRHRAQGAVRPRARSATDKPRDHIMICQTWSICLDWWLLTTRDEYYLILLGRAYSKE